MKILFNGSTVQGQKKQPEALERTVIHSRLEHLERVFLRVGVEESWLPITPSADPDVQHYCIRLLP